MLSKNARRITYPEEDQTAQDSRAALSPTTQSKLSKRSAPVPLQLSHRFHSLVRAGRHWVNLRLPTSSATRLATEIYPELCEYALKKFAANSRVTSEMRDDFQARAAHLAQPRVDELVRADQTVNGAAANRLIVDAATIAAHMVLRSIRQRNLS